MAHMSYLKARECPIPGCGRRMKNPGAYGNHYRACRAKYISQNDGRKGKLVIAEEVGVVDSSREGNNMYGCEPCPKCGSVYRAPFMRHPETLVLANGNPAARMTIECDDCGYRQWAEYKKEY